ncbi:MAG: hypothetical protein RQ847_03015 [Wenzhouxiangellaceae bacterium]|nr:hypothetical protein [Wenzhouxiangellaceae bacterium]
MTDMNVRNLFFSGYGAAIVFSLTLLVAPDGGIAQEYFAGGNACAGAY